MAEKINLGAYELDTSRLEKSLSTLQDRYFELKKEQEAYSNQTKDAKRQIDLLTKAQELLSKAAGDNTEAMEANQKELNSLTKSERELFKAQQNVSTQMSVVKKEINQTNTQLKAYQGTEAKTTSLIELGNSALTRQINNKNDARAANIALNNVANQLNPNIKEEGDLLVKLNKRMDENTKFIKENSSETAKQKMNVGNYTESILDAYRALEIEKKGLEENKLAVQELIKYTEEGTEEYKIYIQQLNVLNVQINNVTNSMSEAKGEVGDLNAATDLLNGGLTNFISNSEKAGGAGNLITNTFNSIKTGIIGATKAGLAFIATPIGAAIAALALAVGLVVGAFKLAKASMESTEEGSQKLAVVMGTVRGIFKGVFDVVKPLGLFLGDVFLKSFDLVIAAAEKAAKTLSNVWRFFGNEAAANALDGFTAKIKEAAQASAALAKAEGELVVMQRQATKTQLDYQKQAEKLRQQRDDETKSIQERVKINEQLGQVLQQQANAELAIANKGLEVANLKVKAEGETTDALNARAEAETRISDITERIAGQESEQLSNLNSLRREAAAIAKEQREKALSEQLAQSRAEIDLFVAQQGFKIKSAEEEYEFNKQLLDKELADLELHYKNGKLLKTEYEVEKLRITTDYAASNASLMIENAQLEVDAEIEKNNRILENDKYLSEEQYKIKRQALSDNLAAELEFEALRLEQGQINQQEYNAAINAINEENRLANEELTKEREVSEKERQLIDLENQKIINQENFLAQAEIEKQQNDIRRQQEIDNAEQTGASIADIEAKYAEINKQLDGSVNENKVQLASDAFGSLAAIFGAESAAGKAAAIAQTTIDTYQSAVSAFKSLSGIPVVGPALGAIASAAAVAAGIANVKKITATKSPTIKKPNYASGVIGIRGAGTGESDDIQANLSSGESVINARATSMYANELAAINQAGGGVGINGASNILNQNMLQEKADNSKLVSAIAEAVAIGSELGTSKGSQKGIVELSDNRKVMADAKF